MKQDKIVFSELTGVPFSNRCASARAARRLRLLRRFLNPPVIMRRAGNRKLDTESNTCNLRHANRDFGGDDAATGDGMESTKSASRSRADNGLPARRPRPSGAESAGTG